MAMASTLFVDCAPEDEVIVAVLLNDAPEETGGKLDMLLAFPAESLSATRRAALIPPAVLPTALVIFCAVC
ncbi:hypothetical protein NUW54_g4736 [Trametes sanguinea]|uniref:Uncharacterized protein n=1 Tax=Trametes sanguinea TaxID=158606 RepID=A0ACC1PX44_9APHY|nr:hypothetical protein NUW54_g4736 [Trametes sanguinea]